MNAASARTSPAEADPLPACRSFALAALDAARANLDRIALHTEMPDLRDVTGADLLEAAHDLLARSVSP